MNTIIERITEAIKDILIGLIKSSLDNMFTSVNEQVGTIAGQVGQGIVQTGLRIKCQREKRY